MNWKMTNKIACVFALLLGLSGCANHQYGNFSSDTDNGLAQQVVSDAVLRLLNSYPSGKTVFKLDSENTKDAGEFIEAQLRDAGFGVNYQEGIPLNYIFDDYSDNGEYRLTLIVDGVKFSRVYFAKHGDLLKSPWTVVEP